MDGDRRSIPSRERRSPFSSLSRAGSFPVMDIVHASLWGNLAAGARG
jgi:hypothetical protein